MKLFSKPEPLPPVLRDFIKSGEHLLAWTHHASGFVAVTDQQFITTEGDSVSGVKWHYVLSASWTDPQLTVVVADGTNPPQTLTWSFAEPGLVPTAVRDRVTSTVLVDKAMDVADVGRVRFVAHRTPQGVEWTTIADESVVASSETQDRIRSALRNLRSALGI